MRDASDGNPFFVEEVLRHLIESGVMFEREGRWAASLTLEGVGVPARVEEVLMSRIGRLPDGSQAALGAAAILGREFSFDVLLAMSGGDEEELIEALEAAVGAQLIVEEAAGGAAAYAFTHALVRETLYRPSERRAPASHARRCRAGDRVARRLRGRLAGRRDRDPPPQGRARRRPAARCRVLAARRRAGPRAARVG